MVPILNHSLFINKNNNITKVIIDIIIDIELEITIFLVLNSIDLTKILFPLYILPLNLILFIQEFNLYSGEKKNISFIIFK